MTQFLRAWHGCMLHNANHCSECKSCSCHEGEGPMSAGRRRGPKPTVEYDGQVYSCRSYNVEIPDLSAMSRTAALVWLIQNTVKRGYSSKPAPVNLGGFKLVVR